MNNDNYDNYALDFSEIYKLGDVEEIVQHINNSFPKNKMNSYKDKNKEIELEINNDNIEK